jgi:hypothetical protein
MPFDNDEDPFIKQFFARIPEDVAASYTPAQLDAVKLAFGARTRGAHAVDIRLSIPLIVRSFYVVLLAGSERRGATRRALERFFSPLWTFANALFLVLFCVFCFLAAVAVLYALKMGLGIDIVPGVDMLPDETLMRWLR